MQEKNIDLMMEFLQGVNHLESELSFNQKKKDVNIKENVVLRF